MHPMLNIAVKAARRAGDIIVQASRNLDLLNISKKSRSDFVSEVDRAAEEAIIRILRESYPDHAILAEESGASGDTRNAEFLWIIDPLDGTTNFLHGFPQYSVSIALKHKDILSKAVVYNPNNNELFTASKGGGAYLNNQRLRVSKRIRLEDCLIGTGIPFRDLTHMDAYLNIFKDIIPRVAGIRRPGSAALDLSYVAAGRYDGFWEIGLAPWDMAAGVLMIKEAGGLVGDLEGDDTYLESGQILAGNPKIFSQLLQIISPHLTEVLKANHRSAKKVTGRKSKAT